MKQTVEQAVESATACYYRAKAAHDRLDALSRQRHSATVLVTRAVPAWRVCA